MLCHHPHESRERVHLLGSFLSLAAFVKQYFGPRANPLGYFVICLDQMHKEGQKPKSETLIIVLITWDWHVVFEVVGLELVPRTKL